MIGGDVGTGDHPFVLLRLPWKACFSHGCRVCLTNSPSYSAPNGIPSPLATDQSTFGTAMTLNGAYSWSGDVTTQWRRCVRRETSVPTGRAIRREGPDGNRVNPNATEPVRRFQWWGWLSRRIHFGKWIGLAISAIELAEALRHARYMMTRRG